MNIVQTLQMQPSTANFKAIDVSLDNSMAKAGQEVVKGLTSAIGDIAETYVEKKNEAAYGAELSAFEKKAVELSEAMQNSDMPLTERKRAVENLYKSSPRLKAEDRTKYAKMYGLDIYADLYKEQESDKVAAQSEMDKATVKGFETQYPGLSTSLSYDEKLSAAKNLQIARSTVAGYLTYQNELDDLNKTVFRGALDVIALQDLRNHLSSTNLSSLNAEQLADMEVQLTQSLAGIGVDLREADDIAKELIEPHIQVLKRYSETSEVSTKALNAAFYNSLPPLARRALDNPELLQYLPQESRHAVDVSLAKAATQDQPSIRKAFSYRGSKEANPQAVAQTQTSFNIGFVVANGASREDDSVTRNITLEVTQNTADMQNVSLTGEEKPSTQTVVEAVSKLPEEGQKAALNNAAAIRQNVVTILDAYHKTEDPVLKEKLKNEYIRALKGEVQASLGLLVPDLKAAEDQKIKLVYDPDKKYARIYEDVSMKSSVNPVKALNRSANILFSGGKPKEQLEERTYNKGFLGFGGEAERSYLRKVGGIQHNYYEAADSRASAWKQDGVLTDDEIGAVWQDVLSDITDKNGYVNISGYISDVGEAAAEGLETAAEVATAVTTAPGILLGTAVAGHQIQQEKEETKRAHIVEGGHKVIANGTEYATPHVVSVLTGLEDEEEIADNISVIEKEVTTRGSQMSDSDRMQLFITAHLEDFKDKVYIDSDQAKKRTIGYGTNLEDILPINKEYLNSLDPEGKGYQKALEGKLKITKEQAAVLLLNSYEAALGEYQRADLKTSAGVSLSEVYAKQPPEIQRVLIDLMYNMGAAKTKGFTKMWTALDKGDIKEAMLELVDSDYLTQVGRRSRRNLAAMTLALPRKERKKALEYVRDTLNERGKGKKVKALRIHQDQAKILVPEFAEVFSFFEL